MGNSVAAHKSSSASVKHPAKVYLAEKLTKEDFSFTPNLICLGDSVLDNIGWLDDHDSQNDVTKQLNTALKQIDKNWTANAKNLALDGSTSGTLLHRMITFKDGTIFSKHSIHQYLDKQKLEKGSKNVVLLSIGGNDVLGKILGGFYGMANDAMDSTGDITSTMMKSLKNSAFESNYNKILDILIKELNCEVIMILVYEPHVRFCNDYQIGRKQLLDIFNWGAQLLFEIGLKYNVPIIDLSRTSDPKNFYHYSEASAIEPNEKMGTFVVDLVLYCLKHYNWDTKTESKENDNNGDDNGNNIEQNTGDEKSDVKEENDKTDTNGKNQSNMNDADTGKEEKQSEKDKTKDTNNKGIRKSMIYYGHYDDGQEIIAQENSNQARDGYMKSKLKLHPLK